MVMAVEALKARHDEPVETPDGGWTQRRAHDEVSGAFLPLIAQFDEAVSDDLNTSVALTVLEELLSLKKMDAGDVLAAASAMDAALGLGLLDLNRADLRMRPQGAVVDEAEIEAALARRKAARADKDFVTSDAIRDELASKGVEVMDGDPLGWEWRLG